MILRYLTILFVFISISSALAESEFEDPQARREWIESTYQNANVEMPNDFKISQQKFSNSLPNSSEGLFTKGSQIQSQTWMSAGPSNIGGRSRAVEFDKTNPNIIITGGVSGGIWRSVDGGASWVQTTGIHEIASVTAIIQDPRPNKNNNWYCAGGEIGSNSASMSHSASYAGNGIYQSTDNGLTWQPYGDTGDNQPQVREFIDNVNRLAIDPTNLEEDIIYVACLGTILRISDDGNNIEKALDLEELTFYNMATDILITPTGKYYATLSYHSRYSNRTTSHSGIFYSENGTNWEDISPEFLQPSYRIVLDYAPSNENILYFLISNIKELSTDCADYPQCNSICKLEIEGKDFKWTNLSDNLPFFESKNEYNYLITHNDYCSAIKVAPNNPDIVLLAGANCFISYDGFSSTERTQWIAGYNPNWDSNSYADTTKTLQEIYQGMLNSMFPTGGWDFHWFDYNPNNPKEVLSASDHGIHKLSDISETADKNWIDLNNGYCTTQFFDCAINKHVAGSNDIIGGMQDNSTMGNIIDNNTFIDYYSGDGMQCYITGSNSIIVSSQFGNILRLNLNNGVPYNGAFLFPNNINALSPQFRTIFSINSINEKEIAIPTNSAICICNNLTKAMADITFDIHLIDNLDATSVEYANVPEKVLYVGTKNKRIFKVTDFSKDNFSYDIINLPDFVTGNYIPDLWIDPQDNMHFIAIISNYLSLGMLETKDGGETWTDNGGNLEENPDGTGAGHSFRCYERMVYEGDTLHLLGTSDGLFSTKKLEGANTIWMREGANTIGKAVIEDIEVRELDGRIVVATHGNGLFKTNYSTSVEDFDGSNLGFAVSEVFPNPASQQINFVLNSDVNAFVEAKLLDIQGKEVANILSEEFTGTKRLSYNASNLTAGTYFLHISDGTHFVTKKVNIVR